MKLQFPRIEKHHKDQTHRARAPWETIADYEPRMPNFGITRLANITGLDRIGIPVYVAVRPASRGLATAQGKGLTAISAKASALMEAIETWHAERITTTTRQDTYAELQREGNVVDITKFQFRPGKSLRDPCPIVWVQADELISGEHCWIPLDSVSCDFSSYVVNQSTFLQSTNGLASGNEKLEAIVHGLCEVIERDAVTLHSHLSRETQDSRRVELSTIEDTHCQEALQKFTEAGVACVVWDCTSDIEVPVFSALIFDSPSTTSPPVRGPFRGYGCHPSKEVALLRALTEAAQSRLTYISGSRDDLFPSHYRSLQRMAESQSYLRHHSDGAARNFGHIVTIENLSFNSDLKTILRQIRKAGLHEVIVFDLSQEEFGIPVVKVLVPGLENNIHHSRNYKPGARSVRAMESNS